MRRNGYFLFALWFLFGALWAGACGPSVPGGGGDLPPQVRFLPDKEGGSQEAAVAREPAPREARDRPEPQSSSDASAPEPQPAESTQPREPSPREAPPEPRPEQPSKPLSSWIGGPCNSNADCDYADAVCLTSKAGFPQGQCSQPCSRLCPDKSGQPGTFCLDLKDKIPGGGGCISRCDHVKFPSSGCRKGYHCASQTRFKEPQTTATVCLPGDPPKPPQGSCYAELTKAGVSFTPKTNPNAKPSGHPNLTCSVDDAVAVHPPVHGVDWVTGANKRASMFMRCKLALALSKLSTYLKQRDITKVMHYGTYNCRTIRTDNGSTTTLSQHGLGRAIDIAAFWDSKGHEFNLVKHWDHKTTWKNPQGQTGCWSTTFNSPEARVLYEVACDMWKQKFFSLVLTPNYNKVHDNHFHVDLSSSGRVLSPSHQGCIQSHAGH